MITGQCSAFDIFIKIDGGIGCRAGSRIFKMGREGGGGALTSAKGTSFVEGSGCMSAQKLLKI